MSGNRTIAMAAAMTVVCVWSGPSQAESLFVCSTPVGGFTLEEREGSLELHNDGQQFEFRVDREFTIRDRKGHCTTPQGQTYGWAARSIVYELAFNNGGPVELTFLCFEISAGVPADVEQCKRTTTSDVRLEPVSSGGRE